MSDKAKAKVSYLMWPLRLHLVNQTWRLSLLSTFSDVEYFGNVCVIQVLYILQNGWFHPCGLTAVFDQQLQQGKLFYLAF